MDAVPNPEIEPEVITKPPPPIFIKDVNDFPALCTELIDLIGVDNFHCKSTTDRLKVQTANPESYSKLVHFLREEKAEFHTYQLSEDKSKGVVIRNLHPSTPTDLIKTELETRLFENLQFTQMKFSSLLPSYTPKSKLKNRIKSKLSLSVQTAKPTDTQRHTVDTRHAAYVVEMVILHLRVKKPATNLHAVLSAKKAILPTTKAAQCIKSSTPPLTYAKVASNQSSRSNSTPTTQDTSPSAETNLSHLMSSFLNDFKTLINPLISLLTTVISSLLDKSK
ncbi:hypothetical protein QTP88_017856 [Uroleucon formosanum]